MKSLVAILVGLTAVSILAGPALASGKYKVYNLPKGSPMDIPDTVKKFLDDFRTRYGTTMPQLAGRVLAVENNMPESFMNWEYAQCQKAGELKFGYVPVYFYQQKGSFGQNKQFIAFTMEYRDLHWLVAQVKADAKSDAAQLDDNARRLMMAFAMRIGNYGTKGWVEEDRVDRALDLFLQGIKSRNVGNMTGEAVITDFESKVDQMQVRAGHFFNKSNDTAEQLSQKALQLLPADLSR